MGSYNYRLTSVVLATALAASGCGGDDGDEKKSGGDPAGTERTTPIKVKKRPKPLRLDPAERRSQVTLQGKVRSSFETEVKQVVKDPSASAPKCAQSTRKNWFACQVKAGTKLYTYVVKVAPDGSWTATGTIALTKPAKNGKFPPKPPKLRGSTR